MTQLDATHILSPARYDATCVIRRACATLVYIVNIITIAIFIVIIAIIITNIITISTIAIAITVAIAVSIAISVTVAVSISALTRHGDEAGGNAIGVDRACAEDQRDHD